MQCRAALRTLGLGSVPQASAEEIKAAYRRLAKQHHPDALAGSDAASTAASESRFKDIVNAYERLTSGTRLKRATPVRPGDPLTDAVFAHVRSGVGWLCGIAVSLVFVTMGVAEQWRNRGISRGARRRA